jgi:hypothetical protein
MGVDDLLCIFLGYLNILPLRTLRGHWIGDSQRMSSNLRMIRTLILCDRALIGRKAMQSEIRRPFHGDSHRQVRQSLRACKSGLTGFELSLRSPSAAKCLRAETVTSNVSSNVKPASNVDSCQILSPSQSP